MRGIGHHIHLRKRGYFDPFPSSRLFTRIVDMLAIVAGIAGPIFVFPQLYMIYSAHIAAGVSPLAWFGFAATDIPLLLYGIVHRDAVIVITYALYFLMNLGVAFGAIIYG